MEIIKRKNEGDSLKDELQLLGYLFPCGGKGVCGRCKITAPALPVTPLDARFLSQSEIDKGIRIACDKKVEKDIEIDCGLLQKFKPEKLENPKIAAIIKRNTAEIAIVGQTLAETGIFTCTDKTTGGLRSVIGKNSIEFFEKYGVPKAESMLVAGSPADIFAFTGTDYIGNPLKYGEYFPASDFQMPSDDVYIPPVPNKITGSGIMLELLSVPNDSLYVSSEYGAVVYKGTESVLVTETAPFEDIISDLNDGIFSPPVRAFLASLKYYMKLYSPKAALIDSADIDLKKLNKTLFGYGKVGYEKIDSVDAAVKVLSDNKYKTMLDKLSRKTEEADICHDEIWQAFFNE